VLRSETVSAPAGGEYRVDIEVPNRYGLIAEVTDTLGRRVDGAVRLGVRDRVYSFSFTPPPAGGEYTVTLYRTDRYGSRVPVCMFRLL